MAELRRNPSPTSETMGKLPAGTVVTFEGQILKGFVSISVELEDNSTRTGWVLEEELELSEADAANDNLAREEKAEGVVRRKRLKVPEDEQILIKRETTFLYGIQAGPNFSIIGDANSSFYFNGIGLLGGGYIGTVLGKNFKGRFEVSFNQRNGSNEEQLAYPDLSFSFLDVGAVGVYQMKSAELSLGLQYSFGMGLSAGPLTLTSASDLSSFGFSLGAGYRLGGSETLAYILRLRYDLLLNQTYFTFQNIGILFALEFSG